MRQGSPEEFHELESQDVREYWTHEPHDFTPWLADSIGSEEVSHLEDVLGLDLEVTEMEKLGSTMSTSLPRLSTTAARSSSRTSWVLRITITLGSQ